MATKKGSKKAEQTKSSCAVCGKELFRPNTCARCGGRFCKKHIGGHECRGRAGRRGLRKPAMLTAAVVVVALLAVYFYTSRFVPYGDYFGINGHVPPTWAVEMMGEAGMGWVRADFDWHLVEPEDGKLSLEQYDRLYEDCEANGVKILGVLGYVPPWASSAPPNSTWDTIIHSPPSSVERFAEYVGQVVGYFAGRIDHWEIWNEPNYGFFLGTPAMYGAILEASYAAAKEANPESVILFGGPAAFGFEFIKEVCFRSETRKSFDILNVHEYLPLAEGEFFQGVVNATRVARQLGKKEVWLTEMGKKGWGDEQAAHLARTFLLCLTQRGKGLNRVFWYQMFHDDRESLGLLDENGTKKQSYDSYGTLTSVLGRGPKWVGTARTKGIDLDDGETLYSLKYRTEGGTVIAVWRNTTLPYFGEDRNVQVRVKGTMSRTVDLYGNEIEATQEGRWVEVPSSWKPIYIIVDRN
jgi:hypothetical protein